MSNDLGSSTVEKIDQKTGYPMDSYGNLLNPISSWDGAVVPNWETKGTELPNFTNPYGCLEWAIGNGDDFVCYDYAVIDSGPRGQFIILDATRNSETASFIESACYAVLPCNTKEERIEALRYALWMRANLPFDDVRHSRKGWNQDLLYFVRCVAMELFPLSFQKYDKARGFVSWPTEHMKRYGGKRIDAVLWKLVERQKDENQG